jgi:hypothetical protein
MDGCVDYGDNAEPPTSPSVDVGLTPAVSSWSVPRASRRGGAYAVASPWVLVRPGAAAVLSPGSLRASCITGDTAAARAPARNSGDRSPVPDPA